VTPLGAVPAGMTCPACGVAAPAAARFCPACGERLAGGLDERRVVTVLFADLVGHESDLPGLIGALDHAEARTRARAVLQEVDTQAEGVGR
jgi:hypothetical protein